MASVRDILCAMFCRAASIVFGVTAFKSSVSEGGGRLAQVLPNLRWVR